MCLALHITPDKPHGWEYSVFVFLFLNSLSFTLIALSYLLMFIAARTTRLAVSCDRRSTESAIAWRMTLLVATDAACWVPIIGLGLASLAGFTIPPQVRVCSLITFSDEVLTLVCLRVSRHLTEIQYGISRRL